MRNLLKRSFSGIVYVLLFVSSILIHQNSYLLLTTIFAFVCLWEFLRLIDFKNLLLYPLFLAAIWFLVYNPIDFIVLPVLTVTIISSLHLSYLLFTLKNVQSKGKFRKTLLSLRYPILSFCFLVLLPFYNTSYNRYFMICILVLIWVNDSFAFLVGKNFGKRKLFEKVSPKKTVEGFLGGLGFAVATAVLISYLHNGFSPFNWMVIAIIVSCMGTIGDLVESKFKREAGMKDSGNIMPGHGGLMDRLDSLLFAAPFVYLYIKFMV